MIEGKECKNELLINSNINAYYINDCYYSLGNYEIENENTITIINLPYQVWT